MSTIRTLDIPLPEQMRHPLPKFLQKWQIVLLLEHWNLGTLETYKKHKRNGVLKPLPLQHHDNHHNPRYATEDVLAIYIRALDTITGR